MSSVPQVPKVRMVEGFLHKLRTWWEHFTPIEKLVITRRLGNLPLLFKITPDKHVIRALIQFWDLDRVVFAFKDFELTPKLEEILYFTSLKYGRSDSYNLFRKEFSYTQVHWQVRRPIAFVVALLGTLVFPREQGYISTCICSVDRVLFEGVEWRRTHCGCNLLLQMWAMEDFHQRKNMDDICFSNINHINSFYDRMKEFVYPVGTDDWYEFLAHRTSDQVQWKYPLLPHSPAYIRCKRFYYIEFIGLKGLQPYAPVRVLQQFGQAQVIPLRANMRNSEISFRPNFEVPRASEILHEWDNILTIDIGNGPEKEIPEYQVWFQEGRNSISSEGEQGFEDIGTTIWIRHSLLGTKIVTPGMWAQMENIMRYLDNAGAGPSNVGPSSSLPPPALICVNYELADHPYFTRSKARADMTDSGASDQNGLGLVTVLRDEPEISKGMEPIPYNEHIVNLMQKMANMQSEIDRLQNLTNLSITLNTPLPEHGTNTATPPLFPHVDSPTPQYFPPNPSLHKTNPTASKQSTDPQQPNFPQNNLQQANPLPFTTSYAPQTSLTQTSVIQTNSLT
ncbi:hypothetical protein H5410_000693 [Solanum commersonii]|uniref:DUF7745 domain-containing protein n=1 Tax=Solanum commersonii TaxID=4109 RepID=A0A9J6AWY0_SOLCO|nr:hypothetical protein H5410_000693 [Solanum commersonii]